MKQYSDRTAVIVGGTHGMGLATARMLVEGGARVLVTGSRPGNVEAAASRLGPGDHAMRSDVSRLDDIATLAEAAERLLAPIDLLFVNAGIGLFEPFPDVTEATFDRYFAVNAKGAFFAAQRLSGLVREGGAIVFTTVTPGPASAGLSVYSGAKAAVRAFAGVLAAELLPRRIRVNAVAPGFIATPTLGVADATPEERQALERLGDEITPMRRHGRMEEVARAVLFLAFEATFTTGAELPVDGGLSQVEAPRG